MASVPVLTGPTASGKTQLALQLAQEAGIEVISADASLVYRGLDIGTDKPGLELRQTVRHHLIDILEPSQAFSVVDFVRLAEEAITNVLELGKIPLVVGGTGYYVRALSEGFYQVPEPGLEAEVSLWNELNLRGEQTLLQELRAQSLEDAERVAGNPRRLVRALAILRTTGIPPAQLPRTTPKFLYRKLVLWPEWDWLLPRLEARVQEHFERGLVAEVAGLLAKYPEASPAFQAIGYKEVVDHVRGRRGLEATLASVVRATTQYAKRQYTWFRKEPGEVVYLSKGAGAAWEGFLGWFRAGP